MSLELVVRSHITENKSHDILAEAFVVELYSKNDYHPLLGGVRGIRTAESDFVSDDGYIEEDDWIHHCSDVFDITPNSMESKGVREMRSMSTFVSTTFKCDLYKSRMFESMKHYFVHAEAPFNSNGVHFSLNNVDGTQRVSNMLIRKFGDSVGADIMAELNDIMTRLERKPIFPDVIKPAPPKQEPQYSNWALFG
ncbi:hypothetical protein ACNAUY_08305 [Acinetobacter tibetensis]|uniref:hypothetical protein n=1 Tax=Acinetobacter tibetensis TaxID=2943497 RepID=UPI003A4E2852